MCLEKQLFPLFKQIGYWRLRLPWLNHRLAMKCILTGLLQELVNARLCVFRWIDMFHRGGQLIVEGLGLLLQPDVFLVGQVVRSDWRLLI